MTLTIEFIPSMHHSSRRGHEPRATVIHYTGWGSVHSTARWFAMEESKVATHYLIGRQGHIIQCVDLDRAAWHCGDAEIVIDGECHSNCNQLTVGIELANYGRTSVDRPLIETEFAGLHFDNGFHWHGQWEVYPNAQIDALQALLLRLSATYPEAVHNLVGHEEIAMPLGVRKIDPGALFPWERFSRRIPRRTQRLDRPPPRNG